MKTKFQKDRAFHKIVQCIKSCTTDAHICGCINMLGFFVQQFEKDFNLCEDSHTLYVLLCEQNTNLDPYVLPL